MEYHPIAGRGSAAVEWIPLGSSDLRLRPLTVALLYARILTVHKETRTKLFQIVYSLSRKNVRDEGKTGFPFPEFIIEVGEWAPPQHIWPWDMYNSASVLTKPKIYQATLQGFPFYFGIRFKMALGKERIFAPASSLLAIKSLADSSDQEGCYELAILLWQINEYYRTPERMRLATESKALAFALAAIREGRLHAPEDL
jgi:hypothetical protein